MNNKNIEIEAHFLDVDVKAIKQKLKTLKATDLGEDLLSEIIFYDKKLTWRKKFKFVRLRKNKQGIFISSKHFQYEKGSDVPVVQEIETKVESWERTVSLLESIGLIAFRQQEKKRHSYKLDGVMVDIDTWPKVPSYVEIEGSSKKKIQKMAEKLGFDWNKAVFRGAGYIIGLYYKKEVPKLRHITFSKIG